MHITKIILKNYAKNIQIKQNHIKSFNVTWICSNDVNEGKKGVNGLNIYLIFDHSKYTIINKRITSSLGLLSNWSNTNELKKYIVMNLNLNAFSKQIMIYMKEFAFLDTKKDGKLDVDEIMKFVLWKEQYKLQYNDALRKAKYIIRNINNNEISNNEWIHFIFCEL
eukprot:147766_1